MQLLVQTVVDDPDIQLIYGVSSMASALKIFRFEMVPVVGLQKFIDGLAACYFYWVFRGELPSRVRFDVKVAYMTRDDFLARHGK
jgi:hypothetical protein